MPFPFLSFLAFQLIAWIALVSDARAERTKVGVSVPLTGGAATYGVDIKNALVFANEKLFGNPFELIIEDDRCDNRTAVNVAQKLVNIDKVRYVLGYGCSGTLLAAAPILEQNKVLVVTSGASAEKIRDAGEYIFRTWPSDTLLVQKLFEIVAHSHRVFGIISEQTDFCEGLHRGLLAAGKQHPEVSFVTEDFVPQEVDFRPLVLSLKAKNPDGIFINTQTDDGFLQVLKIVRSLHWNVPVYGIYHVTTGSFLKRAGGLAEGVRFVDAPWLAEVGNALWGKVGAEYKVAHPEGTNYEFAVATSIEAVRALTAAINSENEPRRFLLDTKFEGVWGKWHFDEKGDVVGLIPAVGVVEGGKPRLMPGGWPRATN